MSLSLLRYYGGKSRLAAWIVAHFPEHQGYVEPFAGGAAVLLAKPRSSYEVLNDLDGHVVNFFRVLRDPVQCERLVRRIELTPYAKQEYEEVDPDAEESVEKARAFLVRTWMSYGRNGMTGSGWARCVNPEVSAHKNLARSWATTLPPRLSLAAARLRGVQIEHDDALAVLERYNYPANLAYCDPPYLHGVRTKRDGYTCETDEAFHEQLADALHRFQGPVLLSHYDCEPYQSWYSDWERDETEIRDNASQRRVEVLWMNPAVVQRGVQLDLLREE